MQNIRSIGGGGDRRLNPNHHRGSGDGLGGYHRDSLNCPRCNSLNTKFCYYNNYNLSQPRFFCKGCRRYWTKGGVLRNVPVGGGVRKPKRSKQKSGNGNPSSAAVSTTSERNSSDSHNSTTPLTVTVTEVATTSFNFQESCFDPPMLDHHNFSEMGESLMTSSSDQLTMGSEISSFMQQQDEHEVVENQNSNRQQWVQATGEINDGVAAEDWGLFEQSYWWNSHDHQLNYFP